MGSADSDPGSATATVQRTPASPSQMWAWALYDWANSAYPTVIQTFLFSAYFTRSVAANETLGSNIWGNTMAVAGGVVALSAPVLGAIADRGGRRKPWIAVFTGLCVLATAMLWFVRPDVSFTLWAMVFVALATMGSEFAFIFYNAMLPDLAEPDRVGRWSGWGWGLGYAGGLVCLLAALFLFVRPPVDWIGLDRDAAQHVRASFLLVSVWYGVFAVPLLWKTPDVPGTGKRWKQAIREGLQQLLESIQHLKRYRNILLFLIARMVYIDGLATVFAFGGVYAAGTFDMSEETVLWFGVGMNITAGLGAGMFAWVDDWIGGKNTIMLSLAALITFGTGILLAPSRTTFWVFAMALGVFVGPVQASSRSFLARIAPENLRNQFFGLYAFSGKATSFLGPLLVGWVTYWANSQRVGMSTIIVLFCVGAGIMFFVRSEA